MKYTIFIGSKKDKKAKKIRAYFLGRGFYHAPFFLAYFQQSPRLILL